MNAAGIDLRGALQEYFGFDGFKEKQEEIIANVLNGHNTFVIMPTGGGKSLCYQLPAMLMPGTAIVISPLIALMKNQVDAIRGYGEDDAVAHFLNSTLNKGEMKRVKEDIISGRTKLLYVAPETLNKEENIDFFNSVNVSFVAVDEAHCISEWGHDFRPEYRNIRQMIEAIGNVPVIALTATATPKVRADIKKNLEVEDASEFITSFNRTNLYYEIRPKHNKNDTIKQIVQIIKATGGDSGIVYVQARKTTEEIAEILRINGINAAPYHAGMDAKSRAQVQDDFLMEEVDVICATIAFGMGIDKPDVRFVIHYDIPKSIENYYQETGRAGRDGILSSCYAFFSHKDIARLEKFLRDKPVAERELGSQLLEEMVTYCETSDCRRRYLLHYFGEEYDTSQCADLCDNCRDPKERKEAKDDVVTALMAVDDFNEQFTTKVMVDILCGRQSKEVKDFRLDRKKYFGKGAAQGDMYWFSVIRQALMMNLLQKEVEKYGVLTITDKGRDFMSAPSSVMMPVDRDYGDEGEAVATAAKAGSALDDRLLKLLKDVRLSVAKRHNVKPWVVFFDPSLEDMATQYPITMDDLTKISGVSMGKAQRYGRAFLETIRDYVEEYEIDRPEDFVVKQVADKSRIKVSIIQGIDKKLPLEDIADGAKMSMDELLDEMNMIVISGTKLNIDYYIDENVDEYAMDDIYDYFSEADSESVDEAFEELKEDDITMEEVKLVRLKFLSEMAN
jgi:ATP-dependent DNA helicase RecQ